MSKKMDNEMQRLSITMPGDVAQELRELSRRERRPISAQLTLIVEKYLQEQEEANRDIQST